MNVHQDARPHVVAFTMISSRIQVSSKSVYVLLVASCLSLLGAGCDPLKSHCQLHGACGQLSYSPSM